MNIDFFTAAKKNKLNTFENQQIASLLLTNCSRCVPKDRPFAFSATPGRIYIQLFVHICDAQRILPSFGYSLSNIFTMGWNCGMFSVELIR